MQGNENHKHEMVEGPAKFHGEGTVYHPAAVGITAEKGTVKVPGMIEASFEPGIVFNIQVASNHFVTALTKDQAVVLMHRLQDLLAGEDQ